MQVTRLFNSFRNRLLILLAAGVFVFTQTIDLQHSHEGDLKLQADCQVCLKLGSQNDVVIATPGDLLVALAAAHFQLNIPDSLSRTVRSYSPRGPPRSSS